jgi:hypothetical protein
MVLGVAACDRQGKPWIIVSFQASDGKPVEMAFDNPRVPDMTLAECEQSLAGATPVVESLARAREPTVLAEATFTGSRCVWSASDPLAPEQSFDFVPWIYENKSWLFDGALIAIPLALLGWIFGRKAFGQRGRDGSPNAQGKLTQSPVQGARASSGSTVMQAGHTLNVTHGVGPAEFAATLAQHTETAARLVAERYEAFATALYGEFQRANPSAVGRVSDPAFAVSVLDARKHYAATEDADLQAMLVRLVVDLASAAPRSLAEISLKEAIDRAPKITATQLNIVALVFVLRRVRWETFYSRTELSRFAADYLAPLLADDVQNYNHYSHLTSLGCLGVGTGMEEIAVFFMSHWRSALTKGIPRSEIAKVAGDDPRYWAMFELHDEDESLYRLAAQTNEQIEQRAAALGLDAQRSGIFQLDSRYLLKGAELANYIQGLHPALAQLWSIWTGPHAPLPRSNPTTVGIALAHARLSALGKAPGPLGHWLR